jgi:hypothetical protein
MALCGACAAHKNGKAIRSSITPMSGAGVAAGTGQFELYKTTHHFDGTVVNPQSTLARKTWMLERTTETALLPDPKLASESAEWRC